MRKIIVKNLIIVNVIMHIFTTLCFAENGNICLCVAFISEASETEVGAIKNWDEKMDKLFMRNYFTQSQFNDMKNERFEAFDKRWPDYLETKKFLLKMETDSDEAEYQLQWERELGGLDYDNGLLITFIKTVKYMEQYIRYGQLKYLFSDKTYWAVFNRNLVGFFYDEDNRHYTSDEFSELFGVRGFKITNETFDVLKNSDSIEKSLLSKGETVVTDIKLFMVPGAAKMSFLYIQTDKNEYLVKLFASSSSYEILPNIELGRLYRAEEIMNAIIDETTGDYIIKQKLIPKVKKEKKVYEFEAESLQANGLLQGNENGLDLLKPLTRAESVAILIRALGLEEEASQYSTSMFSDLSSDNWASPYAALAKVKGITSGVSETEFAPDNKVTSDQFSTFVLRAAGETNVDCTKATQLLIDRGIITAEEAETMDLFTRGDMAKIIYEAREKGLLT